jgi:DNA-binding NarL/FixJ family response regulator
MTDVFTPVRSAIAACLLDGLTQAETSRAVGVSTSTVHQHLAYLCDRLWVFGAEELYDRLLFIAAADFYEIRPAVTW